MRSSGCLVILLPFTLATLAPLIGVVLMIIYCIVVEGEELFPKTANIGQGMLIFSLLLNIPTVVLWIVYLTARKLEPAEPHPDSE